ncbi:MAG: hypothetical protein JJE53_00835 [Candidatus Pacebacteria bacterium]|nr:hypothetical protein [Candidatus Paceibacterota bacterium]
MNDDERKPRFRVNILSLIILIIILVFVFKSEIATQIKSPEFEEKITSFQKNILIFLDDKILTPIKEKAVEFFVETTNEKLQKIQDNFSENVLKLPSIEDVENASDLNGEPL